MKNDELDAATVERCAQEVDVVAKTWREWGHDNLLSARAAEHIAILIRSLIPNPANEIHSSDHGATRTLVRKLVDDPNSASVGATFVPSAEKIATYEAAQAARQPEVEPVAWIEFADNGNIRFWISDPARAWTEGDNGRPLRKFTLAELVALAASPRLDREKVARTLCEAAGAQWTSLVSGRPSISDWKEAGLGTQWFWLNLADAIMRETR